jgi:hypothetical protein
MSKLPNDDQAQVPARLKPDEHRAWARVACTLAGSCQPIALPTASEPERQWFGEVRDVSAGGLLLVLPRRFERGATLILELPGQIEGNTRSIPATVVRVAKHAGGWALGVRFQIPLKDDEVTLIFNPRPVGAPSEPCPG